MLARLAPIAILLAACSDDPGWSRDELPAKARVGLMATASSPAPCLPWNITSVRISGLDTDAPEAVTATSSGSCAWAGDALTCEFVNGRDGTMRIDFAAATVHGDIPGATSCSTDYAITDVVAL